MKIMLKNVRLAFPALWRPAKIKGSGDGPPKYNCCGLLPRNHPQLAELKGAMKSAAVEKWGAKADAIYKACVAAQKICLRDGDSKPDYDGFEGNFFVSASCATRPSVFDRDKTELNESDGKPYAGCYVNLSLEIWAQDNEWGKRINAQLRGVQFVRDGDAFTAGAKAADADEFDDLGMGEDSAGAPAEADAGLDELMM
ncbi:MAG: DUF2815 family protein [Patescibacteria group bacterium]|nr:DUF2815 family protein [Patescibacteria group bacterium]